MFDLEGMEDLLVQAQRTPRPQEAFDLCLMILNTCDDHPQLFDPPVNPSRVWQDRHKRLYMQAAFRYGCCQWLLGQYQDAAKTFDLMLGFDPGDRQHARYWLAATLLELQEHQKLETLLASRDEPTAIWRFAQALLEFRTRGDTDQGREYLAQAAAIDDRFLDYLLHDGLVDGAQPIEFDDVSSEEAAHSCARLFLPQWRSTPGAVTWARRALKVRPHRKTVDDSTLEYEILPLPSRRATWQVGVAPMSEDSDDRTWTMAVVSVEDERLVHMSVLEEEPTPEAVWPEVISAMRRPMDDEPHRPATLMVDRPEYRQAWRAALKKVSIECVFEEELHPVDEVLGGMIALVNAQQAPVDMESFDPGELPQKDDVWQADYFHTPMYVADEETGGRRPWAVLVLDKQSEFILSNDFLPGEPTPEGMWESVARTMANPMMREPFRPKVVEVSDSDSYDYLKPKLKEIGVGCVLRDELPQWRESAVKLTASFSQPEQCGLADGEGVTMDQMESFYATAASYFKLAPWRRVPGEVPLQIRCRSFDSRTRHAIVLGRTGMTLGLAIYDDFEYLVEAMRGLAEWRDMNGYTVIFEEPSVMAPQDMILVERNGWEIASPEAYPAAMRMNAGSAPSSPSSRELAYLEACLAAVGEFVGSSEDAKTFQVEVGGGEVVKLRLSWRWPGR